LNEINQHAHRLDEKPGQFKLADICHPVCRLNLFIRMKIYFEFSFSRIEIVLA